MFFNKKKKLTRLESLESLVLYYEIAGDIDAMMIYNDWFEIERTLQELQSLCKSLKNVFNVVVIK